MSQARLRQFGLLTALFVMICGSVALRGEPNASAQAAYDEAQHYLELQDLRSARIALLNSVKADPAWPKASIAQAGVFLALFDPVSAQASLEHAIVAGASRAELAHLLGEAYWMQGEYAKAEALLVDAQIPKPNKAYALRILGRVFIDKGEFAKAEIALSAALGLAPDDSMVWTDLARLRLVVADQGGAIEAIDRALALDAKNIRALEFRGRLLRTQFGVVAALPWFERALQINPNDVPLLEEYAATLGDAGRYADMLVQARKIISLDSDNSRAFYMQAVLAARAGNYELARRILPKSGMMLNAQPAAILLDAICEFELGNYNRAVAQFERLLALQPRNRKVRTLLAQAMYRAGDPLGALETIREIAGRGDADSYGLITVARAFEASDQRTRSTMALDDAAIATVRSTLPLPEPISIEGAAAAAHEAPGNASVVIPYIRLLVSSGELDLAYREALRLQEANIGVSDAHLLVGDIEAARGNLPLSIAAFQKARQISFTEPVMLRLVFALARSGDEQAAGEVLATYLAFNPTSLAGLRIAGYRSLDDQQWKDAVRLLERVRARIGYNDCVLLANLARGYSQLGHHEAAIRNAAIAYRIAPANALVTKIYGEVLLKAEKRPKAAVELLQKAAIMQPHDPVILAMFQRAQNAHKRSANRQ
ncbi:MAG: tetratricopeptide repeat protein [Sphingorhabdus sp.]